jgi:UDP-MurNAc hydroxylase
VNSPRRVLEWMENAGLSAKVLAPGEQWTVDDPVENRESVSYWDDVFGNIGSLPTFDSVVVPLEKVRDEFFARSKDLRTKFPRTLLRMAGPIVIAVEDLDTILCLDFARGHLAVVDQDPDVSIQSQPLHFMLANPYGLQTLGVSARYTLHNATRKWKVLRIVMALDNAELYLRLRYLFSVKLWRHIYARRHGAWGQVRYQLQRMLPNT